MEADYGIPYFCGLPLERYGLERWLSRFSTAAKGPRQRSRWNMKQGTAPFS
ncbi:hypothetical protein M5E87_06310 [Flavonifractor plautii]|nr:hypothetical protein M5E87_06310 [Flavonifractor plautii]